MRKQCKKACCNVCRIFGHEEDNSVQAYAAKTKPASFDEDFENLMDQDEMEEIISEPAATAQDPQTSERPKPVLTAKPFEQNNEDKVIERTPAGGREPTSGQVNRKSRVSRERLRRPKFRWSPAKVRLNQTMQWKLKVAKHTGRQAGRKALRSGQTIHQRPASEQRFQLVTSKSWKKTEGRQPPLRLMEVGASASEDFALHKGSTAEQCAHQLSRL
ncbi:hypothetical protein HPB47_004324 [Ixodes persulcatus]|uniref:Uncharacterized protein n=1 Tax=Ixodes persulcatus TaxID=34615 RepID=A0AC60PG25_IXOPE|nr:hypothetical protein HPB47_004324 [Ixodes persulcatus]